MLFRSKTAIQNDLEMQWLDFEFQNQNLENSISISVFVHYWTPNANMQTISAKIAMLSNDNNTQQWVNSAT